MTRESCAGQGEVGLRVGPRGWQHPAWQGCFYPEDLPEDWRLAFLATVAQAVLVPQADWVGVGEDGCARWAAEVPESFRFYIEVEHPAALGAAGAHAAALGDRTGGLLLRAVPAPGLLNRVIGKVAVPLFLPAAAGQSDGWRCWAAADELPVAGGVAVLLIRQTDRGLRALRQSLDAFARCRDGAGGQAILVCDPLPSAVRLRELRVLAELLGLA